MGEAAKQDVSLLRLKHRDLVAFVPKFHGMAVNELLRALFGLSIAVAKEVYAVLNMAVFGDDKSPIPVHGAAQRHACGYIDFSRGTVLTVFYCDISTVVTNRPKDAIKIAVLSVMTTSACSMWACGVFMPVNAGTRCLVAALAQN